MKSLGVAAICGALLLAAASFHAADEPPLSSAVVTWEEIQAKPSPTGRARQVFRSRTATLDELELHVTTLPAGQESHPPHKHADEEIIIIKEGTVEAVQNGAVRRLGPGGVIFEASNELHGLKNVGSGPAVYHVIRWTSPGMRSGPDGAR
jgi:quercetin dioxygenase-like cupin family protein